MMQNVMLHSLCACLQDQSNPPVQSTPTRSQSAHPLEPCCLQDEDLPVARRPAAAPRASRAPRRAAAAAPAKYVDLSSGSDGVVDLDASEDSDFELSD